ncbi:stage V sporulation protein AA, partial [Priestia megaterium]
MENVLYLKMRHRIQVKPDEAVNIGQLAMVIAADSVQKQIEKLVVYQVSMSDRNIIIVDLMKVIEKVASRYPHLDIQTIGPAQTIVEVVYKKKQ